MRLGFKHTHAKHQCEGLKAVRRCKACQFGALLGDPGGDDVLLVCIVAPLEKCHGNRVMLGTIRRKTL